MKNTKAVILDNALELFNSQGLAKVKLRTIAKHMGISQGNLNYHFKKREDIIEALYFRLIESLNAHMAGNPDDKNILKMLFSMSNSVMHDLYNYRFFLLDFVQIMRENEKIKGTFSGTASIQRESVFGFL